LKTRVDPSAAKLIEREAPVKGTQGSKQALAFENQQKDIADGLETEYIDSYSVPRTTPLCSIGSYQTLYTCPSMWLAVRRSFGGPHGLASGPNLTVSDIGNSEESCMRQVHRDICPLILALWIAIPCYSQSNTVVTQITSPISTLDDTVFGGTTGDPNAPTIDATKDPYKSGRISASSAASLITKLGGDTKTKTTIIHLLRWADSGHTKMMFDKWYVYDPVKSKASFYVPPSASFTGTSIAGRTDFQLLYIHLNYDLTKGTPEWTVTPPGAQPVLLHPVSYTVTVSKAQTQFLQDLKSIVQILGYTVPSDNKVHAPPPGYFSLSTFSSQWKTSSIVVAASLNSSGKPPATTSTSTSSNQLASQTFSNEAPSYVGLSGGVQITSYKSVTYQSTGGVLAPSSVTNKNVYLFLDGYYPAVLPGLRSFRYIPHPTFGLPVTGKVLRHSMLGGAIGIKYCEPYGGVVFDTENKQVKGATPSTSLTIQPVFGLKISISAVAKALKK
jgi:hypothetical protein